MQTIQQEVYIPQNHQLNFNINVPVNIPIGNTEIMLVFNTKTSSLELNNDLNRESSNKILNKNDRLNLFNNLMKNKYTINKNIDLIAQANEVNNDIF